MRVGVKPGQWGWAFEDLRASWEIAEDCGFHHISCFDHVSASPRPLASWDAPSLLVAMAGATTSIGLQVQAHMDMALERRGVRVTGGSRSMAAPQRPRPGQIRCRARRGEARRLYAVVANVIQWPTDAAGPWRRLTRRPGNERFERTSREPQPRCRQACRTWPGPTRGAWS